MSSDELQDRLDAALPQLAGLRAVIKFDLGADGQWLVDARSAPPSLSAGADGDDPDCTISASGKTLTKLLDGSLDPMLAYGMGRIRVKGSMGVAMKLVSALG